MNWLPGQCACGSAFARVADIGGRRDDDFRYDTVSIPASVFRHILGTDPRVSEYQYAKPLAALMVSLSVTPTPMRWRPCWPTRCERTGCPGPRSRSVSWTDCNATSRPES